MACCTIVFCKSSPPPFPEREVQASPRSRKQWEGIKNLVERVGVPSIAEEPIHSLKSGNWVKFICGASFEDAMDVRNLSLVYTLAGVDCIDCSAEQSVINAVGEGIGVAREILPIIRKPWTMISVNDDQDIHFRKADFVAEECPIDCSRPCERVCPANAISLKLVVGDDDLVSGGGKFRGGVTSERCYGCGRCLPVCPYDRINVTNYVRDATTINGILLKNGSNIDAIEIHTSARDEYDRFRELWTGLAESSLIGGQLKLVSVSLPDLGDRTISAMNAMYSIMKPKLHCFNMWQLDGRPMSGDIGKGATRETVSFAIHVISSVKNRPTGFLQLAGGTNSNTISCLKRENLFRNWNYDDSTASQKPDLPLISGLAYGGYARKIVGRVLRKIPWNGSPNIEDYPALLQEALEEALALVGPVKSYLRDF